MYLYIKPEVLYTATVTSQKAGTSGRRSWRRQMRIMGAAGGGGVSSLSRDLIGRDLPLAVKLAK
jgi:hypothetical protein